MANQNLNRSLNRAKKVKEDEFYTQLSDIEHELNHYWAHFKGKTVLCNCDDPYESNFFKFFVLSFNQLQLKKLICTCYNGSPIHGSELRLDLKGESQKSRTAHCVEITEMKDLNGDGAVDLTDVQLLIQKNRGIATKLKTGDFRDEECIELLKEADIVVTNPPFSLFREYIAQLIEYDKKFVVIGSLNAITYSEIFPLIMHNKVWLGYGFRAGNAYFKIPVYKENAYANGVYNENSGLVKFRNCAWFTNLDIAKRKEILDLICHYSPEDYPHYDNYDAIEVSRVANIPKDYDGVMGVPITFLDKYNPDQFEILGATESEGKGFSHGLWHEESGVSQAQVGGRRVYKRIFIKRIETKS